MKKSIPTVINLLLLLVVTLIFNDALAQNIGAGTTSPDHKLHVSGNTSTLFKLDNTTALNAGVMSEM